MGKRCNPKNTVGTVRAENQLSGDIFSEAERVKDFDAGQLSAYEMQMAKRLGMIDDGPSALDVIKAKSPKSPIASQSLEIFKDKLYASPSETLKGRFWNDIDGKFSDFYRKPEAERNYNEDIAKPARTVKTAIETILKSGSNKKELDARLKRFGITTDQSYEALKYLDWVVKGGPEMQVPDGLKPFNAAASSLAKAQANLNLLWTAGNGADMMRIYSHFATKKGGGVNSVIQGTYDAWKASGGNIFRQIPALKKKGFYDSSSIELDNRNRDPFSWTATAQKNLAYYMDKASGGDGYSGVRDIVFDRKSWDRPPYDRFAENNLVFGLFRYPINEARWYAKTAGQALKGDTNAAANLLTFSMARAVFTGSKSMIPAFVWMALSKDDKESVKQFDENTGLNQVKMQSRAMLKSMGIDAEVDLSDYLQPLGGNLGARAGSLKRTFDQIGKAFTKSATYTAKGKPLAASVAFASGVLALANFGAFKGSASKVLSQIDKNFNSTLFTKTAETTAEFLADEMEFDKYERELLKDAFGMTLKKAD
jgi:hypothetical protein